MSTKIFVDNLAVAMTERELTDLFAPYGNVVSVSIAADRTSSKPRGFGFVTMVTSEGARTAIQALNGKVIGAEAIAASEAWRNQAPRSPRRRASKLF